MINIKINYSNPFSMKLHELSQCLVLLKLWYISWKIHVIHAVTLYILCCFWNEFLFLAVPVDCIAPLGEDTDKHNDDEFRSRIRNWPVRQGLIGSSLIFLTAQISDRQMADNIFKCIFFNEDMWISISISLKFVPKGQIDILWSDPVMVSLLTHTCVIRPQWVHG